MTLTVLGPGGAIVGFGRVITDRATFAYWCDVYVEPDHRGQGLGRWLTECFVAHPELTTCRRLLLGTRDAHELYAASGFVALAHPEVFMGIHRPLAGSSRPDTWAGARCAPPHTCPPHTPRPRPAVAAAPPAPSGAGRAGCP